MDPDLEKELAGLPEVPARAANAYKLHLGEMVEKVNIKMSNRPELNLLTGDNPLTMMFDNHKNHAMFMSNVFSLNDYTLLLNTIPWVYRTYHGHGFAFDYFPAHLSTWCNVIEETLEPDLADSLKAVYQWMISRHDYFIDLANKPAGRNLTPSPEWEPVFERFLDALLKADRNAAMSVAKNAVTDLSGLNDFYINVIQPAMYSVGERWEKGEISVAREHLASAIVNRVMAMQYIELMKSPQKPVGKAVVTAGANEFHEIGATMVANALEADGWEVSFLGSNTPAEEFIEFVAANDYDLVAISVTVPFNLQSVKDVIRGIRALPKERQPKIMVGGQAFFNYPGLAQKFGADGHATDCSQAAAMAAAWQKGT
jgi:methanogenic corrinoid protein MtbC1